MPTIGGPDDTDMTPEPGGEVCFNCKRELEAGDNAYREVFGEIDHTVEHGVVFGTTGGVPVRHFCQDCHNDRTREKAAHYRVTDGDRLWEMLDASDGELVADLKAMLVGGRVWIRVINGSAEALSLHRRIDDGQLRFETESLHDFDADDFGQYFDDPGDRTLVLLKPAEETPFVDGGSQ
jgi:hypothetical protein